MKQKKYSPDEIDRMRRTIRRMVNIGGSPSEITRIHEEHLRTYMANGTTPAELEEAVAGLEKQEFNRPNSVHQSGGDLNWRIG